MTQFSPPLTTPSLKKETPATSLSFYLHAPTRVLVVGLGLGWLFDWLFYGKLLGVSVFLFAAALLTLLGILSWYEGVRPRLINLWVGPAILFFAAMVFVRSNGFLTFLNLSTVLFLLLLLAHHYAHASLFHIRFRDGVLVPLQTSVYTLWYGGQMVVHTARQINPQNSQRIVPFLRGALLALPILFVFTLLLAASDLIFAGYLARILAWETVDDLVHYAWRGVLILGLAWGFTGGLIYALAHPPAEKSPDGPARPLFSLGFIETAIILVLVNGLFILFGWIQMAYLFGGRANIRLDGFTYAEYARRGFFELVTVAVLTFILLTGLHWLSRRETVGQTRLFNGLGTVMAGLVLVQLASAFLRLQLYEQTYGFTQLRLYSHVFMVWLGVLFVGMVLVLWLRPHRLPFITLAAALGFVTTLNLINPDMFIVRQNMVRYAATGDLDAVYLTQLSDDAIPALLLAWQQVQGDKQRVYDPACGRELYLPEINRTLPLQPDYLGECVTTLDTILARHLTAQWELYENNDQWRRWQSAHLSRWRAYRGLVSSFELWGVFINHPS